MKKTLEEYKQEFSKRPDKFDWNKLEETKKKLNEYLQVVKACIADYPDENIGYEEYGEFIGENYVPIAPMDEAVIELSELVKKDKRYIRTLEFLIPKLSTIRTENREAFYLIYKEETKEFANVYFLCGESLADMGFKKEAAYEYETAVKLGVDYKRFIAYLNPIISGLRIRNEFCIKELDIDNLDNCKEIYFLGENGVGKTLLLQSIINRMNGEEEGIHISLTESSWNSIYHNIFAYGTSRFRTGSHTDDYFDKTGYDTLFDRHKLLLNPINFFKDIDYRAEKKLSPLKIEMILKTFEEIIDFDNTKNFKIQQEGINFIFYEKGTKVEFEHLAEGYRSVMIWLCDLLSRLIENQPYIDNLKDFYGVVLVDEVDMFLHPKWEYSIVKKLREKLPNIQWFFTTHSPMLILGASKDAVFYKLYKENGITKISEQWKSSDIDILLANGILTSPLFDMDSARMRAYNEKEKELDTNINYWYSKIDKNIKQEIQERKKNGESYFSQDEIKKIVDDSISKI